MNVSATKTPIDIYSFTGEYDFLSNFFIEPDGTHVEGEYQAAKTEDMPWAYRIRAAKTPGQAKKLGRQCPIRADWEDMKNALMRHYVWQKFYDHPELAEKLKATRGRRLVEGNTWGDKYWGKVKENGVWVGRNQLGITLEEIRSSL